MKGVDDRVTGPTKEELGSGSVSYLSFIEKMNKKRNKQKDRKKTINNNHWLTSNRYLFSSTGGLGLPNVQYDIVME